jgi:hypothetical protein
MLTFRSRKRQFVFKIGNWLGKAGLVIVATVICVPVILIEFYFLASWWNARLPRRPKGVPDDAVFLDRGTQKLPTPRRGDWLNCWQEPEENRDRCRLTHENGTVIFEGDYIPFDRGASVPDIQLRIEPVRTREDSLWVGFAWVPLVHLTNGNILIPTDYSEEAAKLLHDREKLER